MRLAITGALIGFLLSSTSAFAATAVTGDRMVANPTGKGNPDAVTCRVPQPVRSEMAMRIFHDGPIVCHPNRFWADLIKSHKVVTANGEVVNDPRWPPTIDTGLQPNYQPPPK